MTIADPPRTVSLSGGTVLEGDPGIVPAPTLPFIVSLSSATPDTVTVQFTTITTGTATAGADFTAVSTTVTLPPGTTSATVPVTVIGDVVAETTETVAAVITNVTGNAVLGTASATGTIVDDLDACTRVATTGVKLVGTSGADVLCGTEGPDTISGLGGDDVILGFGGDDTVEGGNGSDTIDGGAGDDTVVHGGATQGVVVDLAGGVARMAGEPDALMGVENAIGTKYDDVLWGSALGNRLEGMAGNDVLGSGGGTDDALDGGQGTDQLDLSRSPVETFTDLAAGRSNGWSVGTLVRIENVRGSELADTIIGSKADNELLGRRRRRDQRR